MKRADFKEPRLETEGRRGSSIEFCRVSTTLQESNAKVFAFRILEILNSKSEILNKFKIQTGKVKNDTIANSLSF